MYLHLQFIIFSSFHKDMSATYVCNFCTTYKNKIIKLFVLMYIEYFLNYILDNNVLHPSKIYSNKVKEQI